MGKKPLDATRRAQQAPACYGRALGREGRRAAVGRCGFASGNQRFARRCNPRPCGEHRQGSTACCGLCGQAAGGEVTGGTVGLANGPFAVNRIAVFIKRDLPQAKPGADDDCLIERAVRSRGGLCDAEMQAAAERLQDQQRDKTCNGCRPVLSSWLSPIHRVFPRGRLKLPAKRGQSNDNVICPQARSTALAG